MPRMIRVAREDLALNERIDVWFQPDGQSAQGGRLTRVGRDGLTLVGGTEHVVHNISWDRVHHITRDEPLAASECIEFHTGECKGTVDFRSLGMNGGPARCDHHWDLRLARREASLEQYADSDARPDWLDESFANEHWEDD